MSQEKLGEAVNLTFQQIQKYERGTNRIGASRLHQLAVVLDISEGYFFEDLRSAQSRSRMLAHPEQVGYESDDQLSRRETLELVRAYYRVLDPAVRKRLTELVKAIGNAESGVIEGTEIEALEETGDLIAD